jgi:hypothetical protein
MMEDKEVGELWIANKFPTKDPDELHTMMTEAIFLLIRKLVEERANGYFSTTREALAVSTARALADFGILPEEYK